MKSEKRAPMVSVVITTRNSANTLGRLLKSIKQQSYKNMEIIIVDNNSSDKTVEISKKYTRKVYNFSPERSAQRNFGAKKAKGEYVLILDSDMVLTTIVIEECFEKIKNPSGPGQSQKSKIKIGGVVIPEKSFGRGFWAKIKSFEREINQGEAYFESARFFPKNIFWKFTGYDESLTGPEDWDLPQRIARIYKIERINYFILHNEGSLTLATLFKKKFYYGLSVHRYLKIQNLPIFGPATVYFLRPAFYKNWKKILLHPLLSFGMFLMLIVEMVGGGLGYLFGRFGNG